MSSDGQLRRGTISMFFIVRGQKNVATFCRYLPRVRAAITLSVDRKPVLMVNGRYQLMEARNRLHQAINRFLRSPLVVKLHLLPVPRLIGQGAVDLELPGTDENCMSIREIPEDVLAMPEAEAKRDNITTLGKPASGSTKEKNSKTRHREPAYRTDRFRLSPPSATSEAQTPEPGKCKQLNELWSAGFHQVSGRQFWLEKAFTLDDNNDDVVDNVGFLLKSEDRPDVYIYYFPGQGLQSVITVPSLRIANDHDAMMVCADQEEFSKPGREGPSFRKMAGADEGVKTPNSSNGALKAADGGKGRQSSERGFFAGPGFYFVIAAGVGALLIVFAGIHFFFSKRKSERRRLERRQRRIRRNEDRHQRQVPPEGEERRSNEDRRESPERRDEDERREETTPEKPGTEEPKE